MQIYLSNRDKSVLDIWKIYFNDLSFVKLTLQDVINVKAEAAVAPANSFCFFTGGIDLHYRNYFGKEIQNKFQDKVKKLKTKELLVGDALSIKVRHPQSTIKYLIAAPTMRVPEVINHTINVYMSVKAALREALLLKVSSIVIPGMGMGTGCVTPSDFAKQSCAAIKDVIVDKKSFPLDLYDEQEYMRKYVVSENWLKVQYENDSISYI